MSQLKPTKPQANAASKAKDYQPKPIKPGFTGGTPSKVNVKKTHSPRGK